MRKFRPGTRVDTRGSKYEPAEGHVEGVVVRHGRAYGWSSTEVELDTGERRRFPRGWLRRLRG